MSLKLVSVNIERAKHLDTVMPFLMREQPDVVCLQEVREQDVPLLRDGLAMEAAFAPMLHHPAEGDPSYIGVAILSSRPLESVQKDYYVGSETDIPDHEPESDKRGTMMNCVLLNAEITTDSSYRIGTTHFIWSPGGIVTDEQRHGVDALLAVTSLFSDIAFCGDFNAPRGGDIFFKIASRYTDNIPPEYETSLDYTLHRAGESKLRADAAKLGLSGHVVDGLFTTPGYVATQVRLESGISDHMAIVATISRS